jgi:hypothetical protein
MSELEEYRKLLVRMPPALHEYIKHRAKVADVSMNELVVFALYTFRNTQKQCDGQVIGASIGAGSSDDRRVRKWDKLKSRLGRL